VTDASGSRRFDLVIFDCDGVLVDSERLALRLDAELLADVGWPMSEAEQIERFVGRTEQAMKDEIEARIGRDITPEWEVFAERYVELFAAELVAVPGVADAIDAIQAAGYDTCVASSGGHEKIRRNLALTGLRARFGERIFSGEDVIHSKPAPDLFLHAAATMRVPLDRCAVVEDSRAGVEAGRAAGMWLFGYAGGVTPARALEGPRTTVFDAMDELPALLGV
jgi:HAD superfamily hydrolase (TIGR01509 family)